MINGITACRILAGLNDNYTFPFLPGNLNWPPVPTFVGFNQALSNQERVIRAEDGGPLPQGGDDFKELANTALFTLFEPSRDKALETRFDPRTQRTFVRYRRGNQQAVRHASGFNTSSAFCVVLIA